MHRKSPDLLVRSYTQRSITQRFITQLSLIVFALILAGCSESESGSSEEFRVVLEGESELTLPYDSLWEDPGAKVLGDNSEGAEISLEGNVDTTTAGEYTLTYTATSSAGDTTSASRSVTVDTPKRTLTISAFGGGEIDVSGFQIKESCTGATCKIVVEQNTELLLSPKAGSGYSFDSWSFCDSVSDEQCTVIVDDNKLVSATFESLLPPEVKSNVIILSDDQIRNIQNYSADSNIIEFLPTTDLSGIDEGSTIISRGIYVSEGNPDNVEIYFARRVREILVLTGSTIIVKTTTVAVSDVIESGTLNFRQTSIAPSAKTVGSRSVRAAAVSYNVPVSVEVNPNFSVTGQIGFTVDPRYDLDFSIFDGLVSARALVRLDVNSQLGIQVKDGVSSPEKEFPLGSRKLAPAFVGPVVIVPEVSFIFIPKASAEASASMNIRSNTTTIAGAHYHQDSGWTNLGDNRRTVDVAVQVEGKAQVEGVVVARVATEVFDLAGPFISIGPGAGVEAVVKLPPSDDCIFEYGPYFKLGADIGGQFSAFGAKLKYKAKLLDLSFPVGGERCIPDDEAPTTPLNVIAASQGDESIELTWDEASDNVRIAHYEIWRRSGPLQIATRIQPKWVGTSFTDTGLAENEEYCYFLYAVDGNNNISEAPSLLSCATTGQVDENAPNAVTGLVVNAASTTALNLNWNPATDDTSISGYAIYEYNGNRMFSIGSVDGDRTSLSISGLKADSEYCYAVTAIDAAGNESPLSTTQCGFTLDQSAAKWSMFLACQGRPYVIEERLDLNEGITSTIEVAGIGTDYNGGGLSYVLNGIYSADTGLIDSRIVWRFEHNTNRRVDEFIANLSSGDTGDVSMNQVEVTGCNAVVRLAKDSNETVESMSIESMDVEKMNVEKINLENTTAKRTTIKRITAESLNKHFREESGVNSNNQGTFSGN